MLAIGEMGGRGEGVAQSETGPVYAPLTLPGERVRVRVLGDRAELTAVETPSADRRAPACAAFGRCGGCQLQHWADAPYLAWKRGLVVRALERRGIETEVSPIVEAWGAGRRRAAFHATRVSGKLRFGFIRRGGAEIEDVSACPILAPGLAEALPALRRIAELTTPPRGELTLACLLTDTGVDCDVKGAREPDRPLSERLAEASRPLARLSLNGAAFAMHRKPMLSMGAARICPPPGAFLQPTAEGEDALARLALDAINGADKALDLFCGIGTFALRAASFAQVHAIDSERAMLDAMREAADAAAIPGLTIARRDLLRTPLAAIEMKTYDAVMFDPPRSGARLQAAEIAKSRIGKVAAISCDAATFARDARTLFDGGFKLVSITPVDQFRYTPHVEIVGAFVR